MKNLISNTEFGFYLESIGVSNSCYRMLRKNFDKLLSQKLEIWMFVPCKLVDGVWVVLEEYKRTPEELSIDKRNEVRLISKEEAKYFREYQETKERCLFEGVEYVEAKNKCEYSFLRITQLSPINYPSFWKGLVVEDLIRYKLELTPTAQKQIGL